VAAIAWERERSAADALARRVAEAEHYILLSSGQHPVAGAPTADAALAAALLAAKAEAAAAQERVRAAVLAWERERSAADDLARRVAKAERYLFVSSGKQLVVTNNGASSSHQAPPPGSGPQAPPAVSGARLAPADPMVAQLYLQAAGVQNIRALVTVVLDPMSCTYGR